MDQKKIGGFLRYLRKEKNLTQEQLADMLFVSRRTVSRWETGSNMPDLDLLVELADLYEVDLRDIFNGQRREIKMDKEIKDTLIQAADYTQEAKKVFTRRMSYMFAVAAVAFIIYMISIYVLPEDVGGIVGFLQGVSLGIALGMLIIGFLITGPIGEKLFALRKCRH